MLDHEGWDDFSVVLGSDQTCSKGVAHYDRFAQETPDSEWTHRAVTVGDSPQDMRLGAEHGVPVRIGIDRDGDPRPLFAAGATHVVSALAEVVSIVTSVRIADNAVYACGPSGRPSNECPDAQPASLPSHLVGATKLAKWREHGCKEW